MSSRSNTSAQVSQRPLNRRTDEATEQFRDLGINVGDATMDTKKPPGECGQNMCCDTNVYGLRLPTDAFVYRYDVTISGILRSGRSVEFTKRTNEDAVVTDRKGMCRRVIHALVQVHSNVFGTVPERLCYDLQSILYTLEELNLGGASDRQFNVADQAVLESVGFQSFQCIVVLVKKVSSHFRLELNDLSGITAQVDDMDHSLQQFIELATSQYALFHDEELIQFGGGTSFLLDPIAAGFSDRDAPLLHNGEYLAIGAQKSARYFEGPRGREGAGVGLVVETKKAPFHVAHQSVLEKATSMVQFDAQGAVTEASVGILNRQLKGLHVYMGRPDGRVRDLRIQGIIADTALTHFFDQNGQRVSVAAYYQDRYNHELSAPRAPLLTVLERGRTTAYPLELCFVKDNQRVNLSQLAPRDVATMIKACAVPPPTLKQQNRNNVGALHLHDSPWLREASLQVTANPLKVAARHLPTPRVQYRGDIANIDAMTGKWRSDTKTYIRPATCRRWAAFMVQTPEGSRFTQDHFKTFLKMFVEECRRRGMTISHPDHVDQLAGTKEAVMESVKLCSENQCEFVLFVTNENINHVHNEMKYSEQKFSIVTQDLKMSNILETVNRHKNQTMENIVNKTNEYSANVKSDPFEFVGDFVFDEARRDEKFTVVADIVQNCLRRYSEVRGAAPRRLVIYRNGTSEGQFAMVLKYEVPFIRHALSESGASECKMTLFVPQKMHNIRIFPENEVPGGKNWQNNIKPGTVVDTAIVHPLYNEFYLNSHSAIQGSAKTPRYTVLMDENEFGMDELEMMTYTLSFGHQIVALATSLPSPAYIALEYAKRGRSNYSASRSDPNVDQNAERNTDGSLNYNAISQQLNYSLTTLADQRVNA